MSQPIAFFICFKVKNDNVKALFFDIDGTLVSFKTHQIPQSTVDAIAQAKANGVGVFISTGRPLPIITNLKAIEQYIDGYITTNGALCIVDGKAICCNPIPMADVDVMMADAEKNDYTCIVVGEKRIGVYNPKQVYYDVFVRDLAVQNIDMAIDVKDIMRNEQILQLTPFFSAEYEKEIMEKMPGCVSGRWNPAFTDITAEQADKGKGLEAMAQYLGLNISETMAFGDGGNDESILRRAGIGVAMGNAGDEARAAADYITTSVDDDGVKNALEHFGVI